MIYKVFALPDLKTQEYFRSLFNGCPVPIDFDGFGVELGTTRGKVGAQPGNVYRAIPGHMRTWYDSQTQQAYWILPLIPSPEMAERHVQIGDAWGRDHFVPFMQICESNNRRRRNVSWMNSIADGLASMKPILTFTNELVVADNAEAPARHDFYEDYLRTGGDSTVFLEKTT